jgi:hypothetical protein
MSSLDTASSIVIKLQLRTWKGCGVYQGDKGMYGQVPLNTKAETRLPLRHAFDVQRHCVAAEWCREAILF